MGMNYRINYSPVWANGEALVDRQKTFEASNDGEAKKIFKQFKRANEIAFESLVRIDQEEKTTKLS